MIRTSIFNWTAIFDQSLWNLEFLDRAMTDSVDDFFNKKKKKKEKKGKKVVTATDLLLKTEDTAEESTLNPDLKVNRENQVIRSELHWPWFWFFSNFEFHGSSDSEILFSMTSSNISGSRRRVDWASEWTGICNWRRRN